MPIWATEGDRLEHERAARETIRKMFGAVLADRWHVVHDLWRESQEISEWFAVAVWAGLPMTVRERLREGTNETRRTAE